MTTAETITKAYRLFNERRIDELLDMLCDDVNWSNGWEGGYIHGKDDLRSFWQRQWAEVDPEVQPASISEREDGVEVMVQQTVKDIKGNLLSDGRILHIFNFRGDCISSMQIEEVPI